MKLTISGMNKGITKDVVNSVVDTFNRTNKPKTIIHVVIEDETDAE